MGERSCQTSHHPGRSSPPPGFVVIVHEVIEKQGITLRDVTISLFPFNALR